METCKYDFGGISLHRCSSSEVTLLMLRGRLQSLVWLVEDGVLSMVEVDPFDNDCTIENFSSCLLASILASKIVCGLNNLTSQPNSDLSPTMKVWR